MKYDIKINMTEDDFFGAEISKQRTSHSTNTYESDEEYNRKLSTLDLDSPIIIAVP